MQTIHFHSSRGCLSYITFDPFSSEAALIDPSVEVGEAEYLDLLSSNGLILKYIIETHTHADHISCAKEIRAITQARIVRHAFAPSHIKDIAVEGGEKLSLGGDNLQVLSTPGHTNESISLYNGQEVFTGDALLIGGTGRTDFQVGNSADLYHSVHEVIALMPGDTLVRPGHDYQDRNQAVLRDVLAENPRVQLTEPEFIEALNAHHPPKPELFEDAIEKNSL